MQKQAKTMKEDLIKCPIDGCNQMLEIVYENNGYNPPDPTHYEAYLVCPVHGEIDPQDLEDE